MLMFSRDIATKLLRACSQLSEAPRLPQGIVSLWRRDISCHSASITKIHRKSFARVYPTVVLLPNGASINIRYHEPRKIIKLPIDLTSLTDEERKQRLERRKPKQKMKVEEDVDDNFDANKYINLLKK